ncbi:MAG: SH3 domain-containing protein [Comamonas sp.]|nr:SH3 domain-containing protein [Comamonas sp.]
MTDLRQRGGWHAWVLAVLMTWSLLAAAQTHEMTTAAPLRATPSLNSMVLRQLAVGTPVQAVQTQGGWLKVKIGEQQGWVRLTHVHAVAAARPAPQGAGNALAGLFTGSSTAPTATTGTRGLTQEQLANAQPAPQEVRRLDRYAVSAGDARQFARGGRLSVTRIGDYDGAAQ